MNFTGSQISHRWSSRHFLGRHESELCSLHPRDSRRLFHSEAAFLFFCVIGLVRPIFGGIRAAHLPEPKITSGSVTLPVYCCCVASVSCANLRGSNHYSTNCNGVADSGQTVSCAVPILWMMSLSRAKDARVHTPDSRREA